MASFLSVAFSLVAGGAVGYVWDMTVDANVALLAQPFFGFQAISQGIAQPIIFLAGTGCIFALHWLAEAFPVAGLVPGLAVQSAFLMMTKYYVPSLLYIINGLTSVVVADVNTEIGKGEAEVLSWWEKRIK